jgi:hypothetical protein
MMAGKLSTFIVNGWDVGEIWQRCQVMVSAIKPIAESSEILTIKSQIFEHISPSILVYSIFFTSFLSQLFFQLSLSNQQKHTANRALGTYIHLKARSV